MAWLVYNDSNRLLYDVSDAGNVEDSRAVLQDREHGGRRDDNFQDRGARLRRLETMKG